MTVLLLFFVVVLVLVTDAFGNVPIVNAMLAEVPAARRRKVIVRECLIAFATLALFMLFGRKILELMHLSEASLSIAGVDGTIRSRMAGGSAQQTATTVVGRGPRT